MGEGDEGDEGWVGALGRLLSAVRQGCSAAALPQSAKEMPGDCQGHWQPRQLRLLATSRLSTGLADNGTLDAMDKRLPRYVGRIRERMQELSIELDKHLAIALEERGVGAIGTVIPKLSKLLSGDPEGRRWLEGKGRAAALAAALQWDEDALDELLRESDARTLLIVDPRLPAPILEALRRFAHDPRSPVDVVFPEATGAVRESLRDLAQSHPGWREVVALPHSDQTFLDGAGVAMDHPWIHPRGVRLHTRADLLPLTPPRPPQLWDGDRPLYPSVELARELRERGRYGYDDEAYKKMVAVLERDEVPSFPIRDALPWLLRQRLPQEHTRVQQRRLVLDEKSWVRRGAEVSMRASRNIDSTRETYFWEHGGKFLAAGPLVPRLADLFAPHHPDLGMVEFDEGDALRELLTTRNPVGLEETDEWSAVADELGKRTGVDPLPLLTAIQKSPPPRPDESTLLEGDELVAVQKELRALARRSYSIQTWAPLQLEELASLPLLRFQQSSGYLHVGALRRKRKPIALRLYRYAETPRPIGGQSFEGVHHPGGWLDGGDVRFLLMS